MLLHTTLAALSWSALGAAQVTVPPVATAGGTWPQDLVGTWSSKSNQTLTGPGFYDPVSEKLIEPSHTGISYSFTSDGFYEESYYRAVSNPANPRCPSGIMQWQHGSWVLNATGWLILSPIKIDGRQLLSSPCDFDNAIYTRYNQTERFEKYQVYTDPYHNIPRLDLYQFNGAPLQPLYLAFSPPQMLPTTTLHPETSATATSKAKKAKRGVDAPVEIPVNWNMGGSDRDLVMSINADRLWWVGVGMTGFGALLYLGPRRMGLRR